jgi:hypothetical protein
MPAGEGSRDRRLLVNEPSGKSRNDESRAGVRAPLATPYVKSPMIAQ